MENTELSAVNMEKLILKRVKQLKSKTTRFFSLKSHLIELKAWEIIFEEAKNSKTIHDFRELIKKFYGDTMKIFVKNIDLLTLRLNFPQIYKCDTKKFGDNIIKRINVTLNCIKTYLDDRLVKTAETVKTSFQSSYSLDLNIEPTDEKQNISLEEDKLKSKQIFDSLVTNLRVDKLFINVLTQ